MTALSIDRLIRFDYGRYGVVVRRNQIINTFLLFFVIYCYFLLFIVIFCYLLLFIVIFCYLLLLFFFINTCALRIPFTAASNSGGVG